MHTALWETQCSWTHHYGKGLKAYFWASITHDFFLKAKPKQLQVHHSQGFRHENQSIFLKKKVCVESLMKNQISYGGWTGFSTF